MVAAGERRHGPWRSCGEKVHLRRLTKLVDRGMANGRSINGILPFDHHTLGLELSLHACFMCPRRLACNGHTTVCEAGDGLAYLSWWLLALLAREALLALPCA